MNSAILFLKACNWHFNISGWAIIPNPVLCLFQQHVTNI